MNRSGGWNGPPIAVCGTENDALWEQLARAEGPLEVAIPDRLGIMDGTHRHRVAAGKLANYGYSTVPIQLFPLDHERITLDTWPESGLSRPLDPTELRDLFQSRTTVVAKGTKFMIEGISGALARIMDFQPDVVRTFVPEVDYSSY